MSTFELKKIKIARSLSEETTAFTADLCMDGKVVAHVDNHGTGGPNFIHWNDRHHGQSPSEDALLAFLESYEPPEEWKDLKDVLNDDMYISILIEAHEDAQWVKRQCAKNVLLRIPEKTYGRGEWSTYKRTKFTPQIAVKLRERHGADTVFANEAA